MLDEKRQRSGNVDRHLRRLDPRQGPERRGPGEAGPARGEALQAIDVSNGVARGHVGKDDALGACVAVHRHVARHLRGDIEDAVGAHRNLPAVGLHGRGVEDLDRLLAGHVGQIDPRAASCRLGIVRLALDLEGPRRQALVVQDIGIAHHRPGEPGLLRRSRGERPKEQPGQRNPSRPVDHEAPVCARFPFAEDRRMDERS